MGEMTTQVTISAAKLAAQLGTSMPSEAEMREGNYPFALSEETNIQEGGVESQIKHFPQLRFMGSKYRLLPWIYSILHELEFHTVLDAFSGSGCVSSLLKAMGKAVIANDFLNFSATVAKALIENSTETLPRNIVEQLLICRGAHKRFIEETFQGIFYTPKDLHFLDCISWNLRRVRNPCQHALAMAALIRACVKRQPRGVFTVAGDPAHYKDGRRDLQLSLEEHFLEQVTAYNHAVFDNGRHNHVWRKDVFEIEPPPALIWCILIRPTSPVLTITVM